MLRKAYLVVYFALKGKETKFSSAIIIGETREDVEEDTMKSCLSMWAQTAGWYAHTVDLKEISIEEARQLVECIENKQRPLKVLPPAPAVICLDQLSINPGDQDDVLESVFIN